MPVSFFGQTPVVAEFTEGSFKAMIYAIELPHEVILDEQKRLLYALKYALASERPSYSPSVDFNVSGSGEMDIVWHHDVAPVTQLVGKPGASGHLKSSGTEKDTAGEFDALLKTTYTQVDFDGQVVINYITKSLVGFVDGGTVNVGGISYAIKSNEALGQYIVVDPLNSKVFCSVEAPSLAILKARPEFERGIADFLLKRNGAKPTEDEVRLYIEGQPSLKRALALVGEQTNLLVRGPSFCKITLIKY
jgi:hypothetical protein